MEERNYFTPPLTLANVVWKFFSFKCDGGFPPQIRGLIFDSRTRPRLCNEAISFPPSLSPTNDILSIISIFSNYDLQLGRKNVFNMGRISLSFFFFFLLSIFSVAMKFIRVPENKKKNFSSFYPSSWRGGI